MKKVKFIVLLVLLLIITFGAVMSTGSYVILENSNKTMYAIYTPGASGTFSYAVLSPTGHVFDRGVYTLERFMGMKESLLATGWTSISMAEMPLTAIASTMLRFNMFMLITPAILNPTQEVES